MMDEPAAQRVRVVVIGAGPAGMTAAYRLSQLDADVHLYEASPHVGGLARTLDLWSGRVDLGPHRFFSSDRRVNSLWLEVVGRDFEMIDRLTRIYHRGRYFLYPLRPANVVSHLGVWESLRCLSSYLVRDRRASATGRSDGRGGGRSSHDTALDTATFDQWITSRFGRRLYELFFKSYSEKLWGIPCSELDADFAAQRIKGLSLRGAVVNALTRGRRGRHKTLVDRFAYPSGGTGVVYESMARRVREYGGKVRLSTAVDSVLVRDGRACGVRLVDGTMVGADHVVSTMPLTMLAQRLSGAPDDVVHAASQLRFRNTVLVYLHVDSVDLFPDNWLYVHSPELAMGRITNFRNWSHTLHPATETTILALEYWCDEDDDEWRWGDERHIERATIEIGHTGLLRGARVIGGHVVRLPRCYPVYRRGYMEHVDVIRRFLDGIGGLHVIGRYGAFKYNNQDHSILMGLLAAENVVLGTDHDLWGINADYDSYQEETRISETGLVVD